jgi:hypothetical protein
MCIFGLLKVAIQSIYVTIQSVDVSIQSVNFSLKSINEILLFMSDRKQLISLGYCMLVDGLILLQHVFQVGQLDFSLL